MTDSGAKVPLIVSTRADLLLFLSAFSLNLLPKLYIDLEGQKLSRNGTLSLMTILVYPGKTTYILDVETLGDQAFTHPLESQMPSILSTGPSVGAPKTPKPKSKATAKTVSSSPSLPKTALKPSSAPGKAGSEQGFGPTLKSILEDPTIPKYLWDVRNDADALHAHFGIRLAGVIDVQLFENASRVGGPSAMTYLRGLDTCVEKDLGNCVHKNLKLKFTELHRFLKIKREVRAMMDAANKPSSAQPARRSLLTVTGKATSTSKTVGISQPSASTSTGAPVSISSKNIFATRPLDAKIITYCANDVAYLPALYALYNKRIKPDWRQKAMTESAKRVEEACSPSYEPHGEMKKYGPWAVTATTDMSSHSNSRARASAPGGDDKSFERLLDALEDHYMEERAKDFFGDPEMDALEDYFMEEQARDLGDYYDDGPGYDDWDDDHDSPVNSRDAAWDDTFDSCWEK